MKAPLKQLLLLTLIFVFTAFFTTATFAETINATPELISESIDGTDFSANAALSTEDKPTIAMSSAFRQGVVGIINYILGFLGLLAVGFIIYAGILLIVDSEGGQEKGKKIIFGAAIGILIVLMSYAIVNVIFGVSSTVA